MNILDEILEKTRVRVAKEKQSGPAEAVFPRRTPFCFEQALKGTEISFICEVKRASPSKGLIAPDFPYVDIAKAYQAAGAAAISVLTEPDYFQGKNAYLSEIRRAVDVPLLRKDFVVDAFQITQAAALGADAVLLICAALTPKQLKEFIRAADACGLSALVEAHDAAEVHMAIAAGARVIGVNNRDLKTFTVNMENSIHLRRLAPLDTIFVSESGIQTHQDVKRLAESDIHAVLIGETLMRAGDKKAALEALRGTLA